MQSTLKCSRRTETGASRKRLSRPCDGFLTETTSLHADVIAAGRAVHAALLLLHAGFSSRRRPGASIGRRTRRSSGVRSGPDAERPLLSSGGAPVAYPAIWFRIVRLPRAVDNGALLFGTGVVIPPRWCSARHLHGCFHCFNSLASERLEEKNVPKSPTTSFPLNMQSLLLFFFFNKPVLVQWRFSISLIALQKKAASLRDIQLKMPMK